MKPSGNTVCPHPEQLPEEQQDHEEDGHPCRPEPKEVSAEDRDKSSFIQQIAKDEDDAESEFLVPGEEEGEEEAVGEADGEEAPAGRDEEEDSDLMEEDPEKAKTNPRSAHHLALHEPKIKGCRVCEEQKIIGRYHRRRAYDRATDRAGKFGEIFTMDYTSAVNEEFSETRTGRVQLLLVSDTATQWTEAHITRGRSANEVEKALAHFCSKGKKILKSATAMGRPSSAKRSTD